MNALACLVLGVVLPQGQDPKQKPPPLPIPIAVACARGERKIEIDGSLVDWPELPAIDISDQRQLSGTAQGAWRGKKDLAAVVFLMWDAEALYVAGTVQDEWHRALDAQTLLQEIPVADSLVLSFDPDRNTRKLGRNRERLDDAEFWLGEENSHKVLKWDRLRGAADLLEDGRIVVSHDQQAGITTYEVRIPWSDILPPDRKVEDGLVFDLQIVANDFDETTDPLPQSRAGWTFGCADVVDPGLYGSVMLLAATEIKDALPTFPPRLVGPAPLEIEYWEKLAHGLRDHPPAVHDGKQAPEEAGGIARLLLLEQLEQEVADFPRSDYVELQARIHRRMSREVGGISLHGLPSAWLQGIVDIDEAAKKDPPAGTVRLFRLPQGGWLLRAPKSADSGVVDASGIGFPVGDAKAPARLWDLTHYALQTQPLDLTRRNDQFLLRMASSKEKRPFLTHVAFHLPFVDMKDMPLVELGQTYEQGGVKATALGRAREDGSVPWSIGYRVAFAGGPVIVFTGPAMTADDLRGEGCDVLVLSPRNPQALTIARAAKPALVVVDDTFVCHNAPNAARITLANAHLFQKALLPLPSVIVAPGESQDVHGR